MNMGANISKISSKYGDKFMEAAATAAGQSTVNVIVAGGGTLVGVILGGIGERGAGDINQGALKEAFKEGLEKGIELERARQAQSQTSLEAATGSNTPAQPSVPAPLEKDSPGKK
jgi:hypothetical protein